MKCPDRAEPNRVDADNSIGIGNEIRGRIKIGDIIMDKKAARQVQFLNSVEQCSRIQIWREEFACELRIRDMEELKKDFAHPEAVSVIAEQVIGNRYQFFIVSSMPGHFVGMFVKPGIVQPTKRLYWQADIV